MKKLLFSLAMLLLLGMGAHAQSNAIGLRLGAGYAFSGEVSYQRDFGSSNRLELDLGGGAGFVRNGRGDLAAASNLHLTGAYHWCFPIVDQFSWFVGPGAGIGFHKNPNFDDVYLCLNLCAQGGVQYDFTNLIHFPLVVSADVRPQVDLIHLTRDPFDFSVCLGARIRF